VFLEFAAGHDPDARPDAIYRQYFLNHHYGRPPQSMLNQRGMMHIRANEREEAE
jgi:hypothetical protein